MIGASIATTLRSATSVALRSLLWLALLTLLVLGIGPRTGLYRPVTVLSDSMRPMFAAGDVVVATPEPPEDIAVGQVISFRIPGVNEIESHRVLEVVRGGREPIVRTIGDNNPAPDPWQAQLHGQGWRVRTDLGLVIPKLGWLIIWMRNPMVHLLAVDVAPAVLTLLWLVWIWRRRGADKLEDAQEGPPGGSSDLLPSSFGSHVPAR